MADGFFGRWSQRKQEVRAGKAVQEPAAPLPSPRDDEARGDAANLAPTVVSSRDETGADEPSALVKPIAPPPPTLDDVNALTADSSFAPFVGRDVAPQVRNAAMKKLFSDPHYNLMDGLDIYIDDYAKPSPLPESLLRQMVSAQFLKLVDEPAVPPETLPEVQSPHAGGPEPLAPDPTQTDHDHTDLRLQPDHATAGQEPGRGAE